MWSHEHSVDSTASPAAIWPLLADVDGWAAWNDGVGSIHLHGPFAEGTEFSMTPPGQDELVTRITQIREPNLYVDETPFGDIVVRVIHRLDPSVSGGSRITFRTEIDGPASDAVGPEIGPGIVADFPVVMANLARLAER
jgi:hypothetical protein